MEEYNILNIIEITTEIVDYYCNNAEVAKYQYENLIVLPAKSRGLDKSSIDFYVEKHHILPKCVGGTDDDDNLILLSYREHILAHLLLHAIYPDSKGLMLSLNLLLRITDLRDCEDIIINLNYLDELKKDVSDSMKGDNNPMKNPEVSKKVSIAKKGQPGFFKGKHHSEKTKKILSEKTKSLNWVGENHPMYGKKHSEESIRKMSESHKGLRAGIPLSEEQRLKISESKKRKVIGPDGTIYPSVRDTATALGVGRDVISRYINHRPEKGFKYYIEN